MSWKPSYRAWFDFSFGSGASVFGISPYGGRIGEREWWRDAIIRPIWRAGHAAHNAIYWLRYRNPFGRHQYHLVNTRLEPGYYDVDQLMLHANFALLRRYVEDECGGVDKLDEWTDELRGPRRDRDEMGMGPSLDAQASRQSEASILYRWWTEKLPELERREREAMMAGYHRRKVLRYEAADDLVVGEKRIKVKRPVYEKEPPDVLAAREAARDEHRRLEEQIRTEEQEMLHRLIDIRGSLWT